MIDSIGSFTGTASTNTSNLSVSGKINDAFNFVSGNSEYIDFGSTSILGASNYTILGWFKASSPDDFQRLYTEGNSGDDTLYTSIGFRLNGHIRFTVVRFGSSMIVETSTDYGDGVWHSFMARRSASNDWDLYIDGNAETINSTSNVSSPAIDQVTLGALRRISIANYWNGDIDNVLIIQRAISDAEYLDWHNTESESINTESGSEINAIGSSASITSDYLTDSRKNLLIEGDIEIDSKAYISSDTLIEGNLGMSIASPLATIHLPDDSAIAFGIGADVQIDYNSALSVGMFDGDNWLMNSDYQLQFRDNAIHISSIDDGHLDLTADISIDLNADTNVIGMVRQTNTWHAYGGFEDQAETITCGVGDWNLITNAGNNLWNLDETDGISITNDVFTITNTGDYSGNLSISISGLTNKDFHVRVYNNTQARVEGRPIGISTTGAGNEMNVSIPIYIEATAGDTIQFEIMSADGTDPTVDDGLFWMAYLHD